MFLTDPTLICTLPIKCMHHVNVWTSCNPFVEICFHFDVKIFKVQCLTAENEKHHVLKSSQVCNSSTFPHTAWSLRSVFSTDCRLQGIYSQMRMITRLFVPQLHLRTNDLWHEDTSGWQGAKALRAARALICGTAATFSQTENTQRRKERETSHPHLLLTDA